MTEAFPAPAGVMFDLDGTLILSDRALGGYQVLPGAVELLTELERRGMPFVALTNGSAYPASEQAPRLRALGLPIADDRLFTPNSVAAGLFKMRGLERVMVLGTDGVVAALEAEGVTTCAPGDSDADAVYIAWHPQCTMDHIHAAAAAVLDGAALYSASDVPFFASKSGRAFGYSCAIGGAVARVTGVEPEVTGKPSQAALSFVAARLGVSVERVAVVGDDPRVETVMARTGGAIGIGVTTGTTSAAEWATAPKAQRAHMVLHGVGDLARLLFGSDQADL